MATLSPVQLIEFCPQGGAVLSDHDEALVWASEMRSFRYSLRQQISTGELTLQEVLQLSQQSSTLAQVKVLWALESLPAARKVDTRRKLSQLKIPESVRLGDLKKESRSAILAQFASQSSTVPAR